MKPLLLFSLIAILAIASLFFKTDIKKNDNTASPAAIPLKVTMPIDPPKGIGQTDTSQLKQSGWYAGAIKSMAKAEYNIHRDENNNTYSSPNRNNNLRFHYDANGFTVQPRTTKAPIGWKVAFNLDKQQIGEGSWQVTDNKAEYITGNITVQYINNEEGMRQNFIVQKPLSENDDLQLHFSVKTNLQQRFTRDRLQFVSRKTGVVLSYEQLKVWDASGKPLEAVFEKSKGDYCIHVNARNAVYPVTIDPISTTPAAMLQSNQASAEMGWSVASAGDVNGDGYSDVIVGAHYYDNGETDEGAAFIYHGSVTGINTTLAAMVESNEADAQMGQSVATAGDVNGDGYSDVIVGALYYDNGETDEGAAFVYHGSAMGVNTAVAAMVESNQAGVYFGWSVASAGDINGDGYSDVIVGANLYNNGQSSEGAAFIYHGSPSGISTTRAALLECNKADAYFGYSVAGAGDVNGDGFSDVIVGATGYYNVEDGEGAAFVYHGSATGIGTTAAAMVESNQLYATLGYSVACAGDVNGDGYSDVIAGAMLYDNGQSNEGAAFIYHGSPSGINITAATMVESNKADAYLGWSVAGAGDVNGDGYSDVIAGAQFFENGQSLEGAVFVYHGSTTGINPTAAVILESNQAFALMGSAVASAGDVNGDGYSDLIVGNIGYSNGESGEGAAFIYHGSASGVNTTAAITLESDQEYANMGVSLAGAGDVNGDGYSDIIVGAWFYDNGESGEGAFFVYHGSATGISTAYAARVESNQADANLGVSVAGAGDVNGDGYSDVIVGASDYDHGETDEGIAFVYHGSPSGINTIPAIMLEGNQASAAFGSVVAGAGDVNGDGYSDVIVGAWLYDNGENAEGAAYIFHGSATGISNTAAAIVEGNQASGFFGVYVAGAGDVNGDGFSDVIVGAYLYDHGETDEGAAFVYHGSATGINTTAAAMVEGNQANAQFGVAASGAGDVNGDGYNDVMVGAWNYSNGLNTEGVTFIYHGSATGIRTIPATVVESNVFGANMGCSVASAGDVNSDGYGDIIVGAYHFANGPPTRRRRILFIPRFGNRHQYSCSRQR
jgi:hypothetical protein